MDVSKYFRFLSFMVLISANLPVVFFNLPSYIKSHHIWTFVWITSLFVFNFKVFQHKHLSFILIYGFLIIVILLNTIWVNIDGWNKHQIRMEFYEILVASSVIIYYRISQDYYGLALLIKWTIICILITAMLSIVTSYINPNYARDIIGADLLASSMEYQKTLSFQKYGGGGYSFASALVCLFPLFIYYLKNNEKSLWKKKTLLLGIVLLFYTLLRLQLFANILVSLAIIVFSILGTRNIYYSSFVFVIMLLIIILIPIQYYVDGLRFAGSWFNPNSEVYYKFNDMANFLIRGGSFEGTGIGHRAERYPLLWESFSSNPLFGGKYWNGHLHWMNKLAVYGLIGTIPFFIILFNFIKLNLSFFDKEFSYYFLLSISSILILGSMKTLGGRELWYTYFIIVPGLYYLPLLKKQT